VSRVLVLVVSLVASVGTAGEPVTAVLVAADDLPAGTVITVDKLSQRTLPSEFVTRSLVRPDAASYLVGQRTRLPIVAGEPLLWTYVTPNFRVPACDVLQRDEKAETQVARHRQALRRKR
jgi:pilus assembly protein CpaB